MGINDEQQKFYKSSIESMNKLLKRYQSYKMIELYAFSKENEELVECQELDLSKAYLGLRCP